MFWIKLLTLAIVGGIIGWITNVLAIKFIFRPLLPVNIPFTHIKIQGLIPKRKKEIAKSIGEIIESELISIEEIINRFIESENKGQMILNIKKKIKKIAEQKMPTIIPGPFKKMLLDYVDNIIDNEAENVINELTEKMVYKAAEKVKVSEIIEEKINDFELEKLEEIILSIAKKELKHIEILGGIIGFVVGLLQGIIILNI